MRTAAGPSDTRVWPCVKEERGSFLIARARLKSASLSASASGENFRKVSVLIYLQEDQYVGSVIGTFPDLSEIIMGPLYWAFLMVNIPLYNGTFADFSEILPGCSDARKRLSADEACDHFALNGEIETSIRRRLGRRATSSVSATSPASTVTGAARSVDIPATISAKKVLPPRPRTIGA